MQGLLFFRPWPCLDKGCVCVCVRAGAKVISFQNPGASNHGEGPFGAIWIWGLTATSQIRLEAPLTYSGFSL
jgi:hypothetical protein